MRAAGCVLRKVRRTLTGKSSRTWHKNAAGHRPAPDSARTHTTPGTARQQPTSPANPEGAASPAPPNHEPPYASDPKHSPRPAAGPKKTQSGRRHAATSPQTPGTATRPPSAAHHQRTHPPGPTAANTETPAKQHRQAQPPPAANSPESPHKIPGRSLHSQRVTRIRTNTRHHTARMNLRPHAQAVAVLASPDRRASLSTRQHWLSLREHRRRHLRRLKPRIDLSMIQLRPNH